MHFLIDHGQIICGSEVSSSASLIWHTLSCIFYLQRAVTVCILAQIWTYHVPTDLFQVVRGEHGCTLLVVIIKVTNLLVLTLECAPILPHICKRALLKIQIKGTIQWLSKDYNHVYYLKKYLIIVWANLLFELDTPK